RSSPTAPPSPSARCNAAPGTRREVVVYPTPAQLPNAPCASVRRGRRARKEMIAMPTTEAPLAALLAETGSAHGAFETSVLGGVYDQQWPAWYARYLVEHGFGALLGQAVTVEGVAALLAACDAAYTREQPAANWPDFYAQQLLSEYEWARPGSI